MTLTEVLVGTIIGAMVMGVVATTIFTTNDLRNRADDRSQFAERSLDRVAQLRP